MNRAEFLRKLEQLLMNIPAEERRDALQYYEDYFEDAGPEREQEIMKELVSPEFVADTIIEGLNQREGMEGRYKRYEGSTAELYQNPSAGYQNNGQTYGGGPNQNNGQTNSGGPDNNGYSYGQNNGGWQNNGYNSQNQNVTEDNNFKLLMIVILVVTAPITLPIIGSIITVILSLFFAVFAIIFGMFAAALGLFIAGFTLMSAGMIGFGFWCFGIAFAFLSIGFLLLPVAGWLIGTAVPGIFRAVKKAVAGLMKKGGNHI